MRIVVVGWVPFDAILRQREHVYSIQPPRGRLVFRYHNPLVATPARRRHSQCPYVWHCAGSSRGLLRLGPLQPAT